MFLEKDYEKPDTSNYMKFVDGDSTFRVLSPAITGFEYWSTDKKPIRSKEPFRETPNMQEKSTIKHFWAMVVYNRDSKKIQVLEITQVTIQDAILALYNNKKWGDPIEYDITVTRSGSGMDTSYQVMPNPKSDDDEIVEARKQLKKNPINLEALYSGGDPFNQNKKDIQNLISENKNTEDLEISF